MKPRLKPTSLPQFLIALVAVAALGSHPATAQQARLLVGIMVDGLDADCLELLRDRMTDDGFRVLTDRGVTMAADYGTDLDATAATATVFSGAAPSVSGVGGDVHLDRRSLRAAHVYADADVLGNFSSTGYSPRALRVTNLTDEIRIAGGGTNVAYSVAATPGVAIGMAGHTASSAMWLDRKNMAWASSTAYSEIPASIAARNRMTPLAMRMDTMSWTPSLAPDRYPSLPDYLTRYPFRYVFPRGDAERFEMFISSPMLNREVTDLATELISRMKVGEHEGVVDVLNLGYTLQPVTFGKSPDKRVETMDAYIKLDHDLARLFSTIDRNVGLNNTVIMLASTPPRRQRRREEDRWNLPYGEFSTRKAASLLNLYLIALHGNGAYVSHYHNGYIYLNHKLIDELHLKLSDVRAEAAGLLANMTGVDRVHTLDAILSGTAGENAEALRRNTSVAEAGDLLLEVSPGFEIIDDYENEGPQTRTGMVQSGGTTTAPVYIFAPGVEPKTLSTPVDARAIAPTVARILRIRSPNGAGIAPLPL